MNTTTHWWIGILLALGIGSLTAGLTWLALRVLPTWRHTFHQRLRGELSSFFLFIDPAQFWVANVAFCLLILLGTLAISGSALLAAAAAAVATLLPGWLLRRLRRRRAERFEDQLSDALMTLASALRAGASVPAALRHLADESDPPLAQEFDLVLREQRLGVSFDQALEHLAARMPTEGCQLAAAAIRITHETGGNLAEALERVAATLRARRHLIGRLDALTAQGRLQAWIVGLLPALLAIALWHLERDIMRQLFTTPMGWVVLATIGTLEGLGAWWIRHLTRIDP